VTGARHARPVTVPESALPDAWFEPRLAAIGLEGCSACPVAIRSACGANALASH
jgi:hypothetical protein